MQRLTIHTNPEIVLTRRFPGFIYPSADKFPYRPQLPFIAARLGFENAGGQAQIHWPGTTMQPDSNLFYQIIDRQIALQDMEVAYDRLARTSKNPEAVRESKVAVRAATDSLRELMIKAGMRIRPLVEPD